MMRFSHRPYSARHYRPVPEVNLDAEANAILVATPWGRRDAARKMIERMRDFFITSKSDREATTPFGRVSSLSTVANNLRTAAFLANESLFREENMDEFAAAAEIFAGACEGNEFVWLQCGMPQVFLARKTRPLLSLGAQIDHAFDVEGGAEVPAPLPSVLLGLDSTLNVTTHSFRVQSGDKLVLLSHSCPPAALFAVPFADIKLENLTHILAKEQPGTPFWLGLLEFDLGVQSEP